MNRKKRVKGHLPGLHACIARQIFRAYPDRPAMRRLLLEEAFTGAVEAEPCSSHWERTAITEDQ